AALSSSARRPSSAARGIRIPRACWPRCRASARVAAASPCSRVTRPGSRSDAVITVRDLRVSFGAGNNVVRAVDGVSFEVAAGETFGLVGESGCGKSTILRALCSLNRAWQGYIAIDGNEVAVQRPREFFKRVQMVFQDPYGSLHPRHTVNTTLTEPLAIHGMGRADARISEVLDQVG